MRRHDCRRLRADAIRQTAQRLAGTGWIYEFITMQAFGDLCLDTYFSEDRSPFHFISVNAGLYSLCQDYAQTASVSQQDKEEHLAYARLCRENLETGLAYLPLHIPASSDAIAALLFGVSGPPESCWQYRN